MSEVTRELTIPATREELWEALTSERLLEDWLADEVELDEVGEGEEAVFRFGDGDERRVTFDEVDEGERIVFRWQRPLQPESTVEVRLVDAVSGIRVVVSETGGPSLSTAVWGAPLLRLRQVATGALLCA